MRFEAWLLDQADLTAGEESWLRMVGNQIRANADSMDGFIVEQFALHPFSQLGGYPQAVRVFGSEERLEELVDGLNAAVFKEPESPVPPQEPAGQHGLQ